MPGTGKAAATDRAAKARTVHQLRAARRAADKPAEFERAVRIVRVGLDAVALESWAETLAAALPPLSAAEVAIVGRIAAGIDARLADREAAA